jgi:hypothetical protein
MFSEKQEPVQNMDCPCEIFAGLGNTGTIVRKTKRLSATGDDMIDKIDYQSASGWE